MSKLSFFYDANAVYEASLRALKRRDYKILKSDLDSGTIVAASKGGILKPKVSIEIKINQSDDNQTNMDIRSAVKKNWLTPDGYDAKAEHKLISTLYKLFENM